MDTDSAFNDTNDELYEVLKRGVLIYDTQTIQDLLHDPNVEAKLTRILEYYKPQSGDPAELLNQLKWENGVPLNETMKEFVKELALRIRLHEEQAFQLLRLFFMMHPDIYEQFGSAENELVRKELSELIRPISSLYYAERTKLIKCVGCVVSNASTEGSPCQSVCMVFIQESMKDIENYVWEQYKACGEREVPERMYSPYEREEWFLQVLQEEKELLEVLIMLQHSIVHCKAERLIEYLDCFILQDFQGSYNKIKGDSRLAEYRTMQASLVTQIADLCSFLLLSSIRLDTPYEQIALSSYNITKNPMNIIHSKAHVKGIQDLFIKLHQHADSIPEQLGPVLLAWFCLISWGKLYVERADLDWLDMSQIEELIRNFHTISYIHKLTTRAPFLGSHTELTCTLKLILLSLISQVSTQLNVETSSMYKLLIEVACVCLGKGGTAETLKYFWVEDFRNRLGLYFILTTLAKEYLYETHYFLEFMSVIVGNSDCNYAREVVQFLSNLETFTWYTATDQLYACEDEGELIYRANRNIHLKSIVIPENTRALKLSEFSRTEFLVMWEVPHNMWSIFFQIWEGVIEGLRGGTLPEDINTLGQFLKLLVRIILQDPEQALEVERLGMIVPANVKSEITFTEVSRKRDFIKLAEMMLETVLELSKSVEPPFEHLTHLMQGITAIYCYCAALGAENPIAIVLEEATRQSSGSHPLFLGISKLRGLEREKGDFSVSNAVMQFCIGIISDESCLKSFPLNRNNVLKEVIRFSLNDVLTECFTWNRAYKWSAANHSFEILEILLTKYHMTVSKFAAYSNSLLDSLVNQLNKIELDGFIRHCLLVVPFTSDLNENKYENLHWSFSLKDGADYEELYQIKIMMYRALKVLGIVTYKMISQDENLYYLRDLQNLVNQVLSEDDGLSLVLSLMTYVNFQFLRTNQDDGDILIGEAALNCLTNIVVYWKGTSGKNQLEQYFSGNNYSIKKTFYNNCLATIFGKTIGFTSNMQDRLAKAFLEFLTVSLSSQHYFCQGLFDNNFHRVFRRALEEYKEMDRERISVHSMLAFYHLLEFLNEIIGNEELYPTLIEPIVKDDTFHIVIMESIENMFHNMRELNDSKALLAMHSCAALFNYLSFRLSKTTISIDQVLLNSGFLASVTKLSSKSVQADRTQYRLAEALHVLHSHNIDFDTNHFLVTQVHSAVYWSNFAGNPHSYGENYYFDCRAISLFLQVHNIPSEICNSMLKSIRAINDERSLVASQEHSLNSFCVFLSMSFRAGKVSLSILIPVLSEITKGIWAETIREKHLGNDLIIKSISKRCETLLLIFNFIKEQLSEIVGKSKFSQSEIIKSIQEFYKSYQMIFRDLLDLLRDLHSVSEDILTFTLVLISFNGYCMKLPGVEPHDSEVFADLIIQLSKHFTMETPYFSLIGTIMTYALEFIQQKDYLSCFRHLPVLRIFFDKLLLSTSTEPETLVTVKFFYFLCKSQEAAKLMVAERFVMSFSNSPVIKSLHTLYSEGKRHPLHIIWCWVLFFLHSLLKTLPEDHNLISQVIQLLSDYSERIELLLYFNYEARTTGGSVSVSRQFSLGYLEELYFTTGILVSLASMNRYWKSPKRTAIDPWIKIVALYSIRISSGSHAFPALSESETSLTGVSKPEIYQTESSIFRDLKRPPSEEGTVQFSIYNYIVESTIVNSLANILTLIVRHHQSTKSLLPLDIETLISSASYNFKLYKKITENYKVYQEITERLQKEHKGNGIAVIYGSLNHALLTSIEDVKELLISNIEISFYLLIKAEVSNYPDLRKDSFALLKSWWHFIEPDNLKSEPKDPFLKWAYENLRI